MLGWNEEIKKTLGSCGEKVFIGYNTMFANPELVHLGDRVRIDPFCFITTGLQTGNNVQICAYAMLGGGSQQTIKMDNWTFIGYGSKLFCASEDYSGEHGPVNEYWGSNEIRRGNIHFNDYAGIASDVMVFPGVTLPEGCAIGAKSFVHTNNDLHPYVVYIGDPLRYHKSRSAGIIQELALRTNFRKQR